MQLDRNLDMAHKIAEQVKKASGRAFFVGGYVRDHVLNNPSKDIDIEVHNIPVQTLEDILDSLGTRNCIGESFGIYNLSGYDIDIAIPRKEKLVAYGHKNFDVFVDPFIGTYKASMRRDFTINSLMMDILTGEIIDEHSGLQDLKNGIIRHINDETFIEDPLRVLRACGFASRFNFSIAPETLSLCSKMDISGLSKERIMLEVKKALLKSNNPSKFFYTLRDMNQLSPWFIEVKDLIGINQSPTYHAEGDVFTHTMMVLDEAGKYKDKTSNPFGFMLSALAHDFGKIVCTKEADGNYHAYGHEVLGLPLIKDFLKRLTNEDYLIKYVLNLS